MFGDLAESAKQITDAFAQLNQNLAKQIEIHERACVLLESIDNRLADIQRFNLKIESNLEKAS